MAAEDLAGSLAHVKMLGDTGILTAAEADQITAGLHTLQTELNAGQLTFDATHEDIHMNLEALLTEKKSAPWRANFILLGVGMTKLPLISTYI